MRKIQRLFSKARCAAEFQVEFMREEIDQIIDNNVVFEPRIENCLDLLLDCLYIGVGEQEFTRLNNYYKTINEGNAQFYEQSYFEIKDG